MFIEVLFNLKKIFVISYLCVEYERCKYEMFWYFFDFIDWKMICGFDKYRIIDENVKCLSFW